MIIYNPMIQPLNIGINDQNNLIENMQSGVGITIPDQDKTIIWNDAYEDICVKINGINRAIHATSNIIVDKEGYPIGNK